MTFENERQVIDELKKKWKFLLTRLSKTKYPNLNQK